MSLDVQALRDSFNLVVEKSPQVVQRFYEIFFARYPVVIPMFGRNSGPRQADMLTQALVAVIDHLEDAPWLESTLKGLGAKHVHYGVTDQMYAWVGECLLAALSEAAGEAWTPRVEDAWAQAYEAISSLMMQGAAEMQRAA